MNQQQRELYEQREALEYLVEYSRLRCMELHIRLQRLDRILRVDGDYRGIRSTKNQEARVLHYLTSKSHERHLVQIEYVRETTNLSRLTTKMRELWL